MNREEVANLLEKIQAYRQSFLITNVVLNEWSKILEPYDCEDVNRKLDEYFRNGDNFGRYPDVYYLTKYLKKKSEKMQSGHNYIRCQLCNEIVDLATYDKHFDRCSSADYLCQMSLKKYNKKLNRDKLMNASKDEFDKYYWEFCEKLIDDTTEVQNIHSLKNAILTHGGFEPELNLNELMEEVNVTK